VAPKLVRPNKRSGLASRSRWEGMDWNSGSSTAGAADVGAAGLAPPGISLAKTLPPTAVSVAHSRRVGSSALHASGDNLAGPSCSPIGQLL
jgi:hypothetical protein